MECLLRKTPCVVGYEKVTQQSICAHNIGYVQYISSVQTCQKEYV